MSLEKKLSTKTFSKLSDKNQSIIKSKLDDEDFVAEKDYLLRELEVEYDSDLSHRHQLFESKKNLYFETALINRLSELS